MSLYVACLASYNAGILHGEWIDVSDYDSVMEEINAMLKKSPVEDAEEWAIHDYENLDGLDVEEYSSIEEICEFIAVCEESNFDRELIAEVMALQGITVHEAIEFLDESYHGMWDSMADWAEEDIRSQVNIPEDIAWYIDYHQYASDMETNGHVMFIPVTGGVIALST